MAMGRFFVVATLASLLVMLAAVGGAFGQSVYVLDRFDVPETTLSLSQGGTVANYACTSNNTNSPGLAGGIRKLQITAPSGTNVGSSVQVGVFIPMGQNTAPSGVASGNNNINSPTFQILYRIDGDTMLCSSGQNTVLSTPFPKIVNNLSLNLQNLGVTGIQFNARGDVTSTFVTITLYSTSGSILAQTNPIQVVETGSNPSYRSYIANFNDTSKWVQPASFTGTVGAIELTWPEPDNLQFSLNLLQFLVQPTVTTLFATAFTDCGCNGFQQGSGDWMQGGQTVTLTFTGSQCSAASMTQTTSAQGTVTFTNVPLGCTYTMTLNPGSGFTACPSSSLSQTVSAGGSATFAIRGNDTTLTAPPDRTITCGGSTTPDSTGSATFTAGTCNAVGSQPTYSDSVMPQSCSGPGGSISVIRRTWSLPGASSQTQTITIVDTQSISLQNVPADSSIDCNAAIPMVNVIGTSCTPVTVTSTQTDSVSTCDTITCSTTKNVAVIYTATDQCGNSVSRSVTYHRTNCNSNCPPPSFPPPLTAPAPTPPNLSNCMYICNDDDNNAATAISAASALVLVALAFILSF